MTGQTNSQSTIQQMEIVQKVLDEYENTCGLSSAKNPCNSEELDLYLSMNRDQIEKLSSEDCIQIAYRLDQMSFYIQRLYNREQSRLSWSKAQLNSAVSTQINQYSKYIKHDMKIELMSNENSHINKLKSIMNYSIQRIDRLTNLSFLLTNLSNTMKSSSRNKSYVYKRET